MSQSPDSEAPADPSSPPAQASPVAAPDAASEAAPEAAMPPVDAALEPPSEVAAALVPDAPAGRARRSRLRPRELAVLIRGATLLVITGFCVAAFIMQLTGSFQVRGVWSLGDFVNRNQLAPRARMRMLAWLAAGGASSGVAALALYAWGRRLRAAGVRAARVLRTGRLLWPLVLPGLAWPLLVATEWDALPRASGIAFLALLAEVCVRGAAGELLAGRLALARVLSRAGRAVAGRLARRRRFLTPGTVIVLLGSAFYAVWMSYGTILQHREFGTAAFDLGNYDTMFFNTLHGHPFRCLSVLPKGANWSMLSNHAELTMFVLLPLYALHPGPETLLVLQAVALASGALPLYRFASRRVPQPAAVVLALAYLLYAPMHEANFYDIHFQPFAVAFTLWALDMLDGRRPVLFVLFFQRRIVAGLTSGAVKG